MTCHGHCQATPTGVVVFMSNVHFPLYIMLSLRILLWFIILRQHVFLCLRTMSFVMLRPPILLIHAYEYCQATPMGIINHAHVCCQTTPMGVVKPRLHVLSRTMCAVEYYVNATQSMFISGKCILYMYTRVCAY